MRTGNDAWKIRKQPTRPRCIYCIRHITPRGIWRTLPPLYSVVYVSWYISCGTYAWKSGNGFMQTASRWKMSLFSNFPFSSFYCHHTGFQLPARYHSVFFSSSSSSSAPAERMIQFIVPKLTERLDDLKIYLLLHSLSRISPRRCSEESQGFQPAAIHSTRRKTLVSNLFPYIIFLSVFFT